MWILQCTNLTAYYNYFKCDNIKILSKTIVFCFSDVSFLKAFEKSTCIILDHNNLTSKAVFPYLPKITVLWLNYNQIEVTEEYIKQLRKSFPSLRQLSLMGNPGAPLCQEETFYEYLKYRLFVICCFPNLEHLDDRPVTIDEKVEAQRLYGKPLIEKLFLITEQLQNVFSKFRQYMNPNDSSDRQCVI